MLTLSIHDTRFTIHDKGNTPLSPPLLRGELKGGIVHHASWIVHHHLVALFSALIFVSHPVQTQAVTYIWQRVASLATFFYLLSLVMYIKFRIHDTKKMHDAGYTIHDKENHTSCIMNRESCIVITLPVVTTLYEFMFLTPSLTLPPRGGGMGGGAIGHALRIRKRILYLIPLLLTMLIIPLSLIGIDKPVGELISDVNEVTKTTTVSVQNYLLTQFRVIVTYIRLLFFPINQNLDYDYPVYNSFFEPQVVLSFLFLLSIFGLGVYLLYRSRVTMHDARYMIHDEQSTMHASRITHHALRFIAFGIFWFFITLSIESSIMPVSPYLVLTSHTKSDEILSLGVDIIHEHRLYLSSIGFIIAFSMIVFYCTSRIAHHVLRVTRYGFPLLLTTVVIIFSIAAYQRNTVWKDEVSLWEDVVSKSPKKARGYHNLGLAYREKWWIDRAIEQYQIALRLEPDFAEAHTCLGFAYFYSGAVDKAIGHYEAALKLGSNDAKLHLNLGIAYKAKGLLDKAREHFNIARRLNLDLFEMNTIHP
ncbi:MAG: tetratricopeptide repeat protein [Nitrospirae bacterium]|nr:tetratricopeptide repeat protein [Nitrospirota bacterium]